MYSSITAGFFIIAPTLAVVVIFWITQRWKGVHLKKTPVAHKVGRFPGYSLIQTIEKLKEKLTDNLTMLVLIPVISTVFFSPIFKELTPISKWVIVITFLFLLGVFIRLILIQAETLKNYKLGLKGEQIVGNQLMELLRHGCHVFHDVPMDYENIDHVVVGPSGVFTIETKMRRKEEGEEDGHKLYYNGKRLRFGKITTSSPLEQAKRQGEFLSSLLGGMFKTGEVSPIVIYPGWWVEQEKGAVDVLVMNDKVAMNYLSKQPRKLDEETVESIANFFRERCRDVEV